VLAARLHWRLLIGTILILMAAAWLAPRWLTLPEIQENRVLAPAPQWPHRLKDFKTYRKAADAYVADHFAPRVYLIAALNRLRMMVGVSGSNRVIVGREGWLFFDDDTHLGASRGDPAMTASDVRNWLMFMAGRTEALKARSTPYLVVAAPVKEIIYPQRGPSWYKGPSNRRPTIQLPKLVQQTGVGEILYLGPYVADATQRGQKTYSRHDTHWTGYGAYAGYAGLMQRLHSMGVTEGPRPMSDFELIGGGQKIRPRDLALMLGVASYVPVDFPHIDNPKGWAKVHVTYLGDRQDWTAPQVIDTGEVGKPVLLMTRDSYSNEMLPMMFPHFSRIVLAHNQDGTWRPDLIQQFKPDIVILEVVEHGMRVSMREGPPASAEALARIDHVLGAATKTSAGPVVPGLRVPDARTAAALGAARTAPQCNVESASLTPGMKGEGSLRASGWITEMTSRVTSPDGMIRIQGPGVDLIGPLRVDISRPDVANAFHTPSAEHSAYVANFFVAKMPPGAYQATIYRRARDGWIKCLATQPLVAP
jgi:hypothetical protein